MGMWRCPWRELANGKPDLIMSDGGSEHEHSGLNRSHSSDAYVALGRVVGPESNGPIPIKNAGRSGCTMTKQAFVFSTEDRHECVFVGDPGELHREMRRIVREWGLRSDLKRERKPDWDKYYDTGVPKQEQARAGYYVDCDNCDTEVVFEEWFEIENQVFCFECARVYLEEHIAKCKCGECPKVYVSETGTVDIECPECTMLLSDLEGSIDEILDAWESRVEL